MTICPSTLSGASSSTNAGLQLGATDNVENAVENAVPLASSAQDESGVRSSIPPIQDHQHRTGRDSSTASTSQELWGSLTSYMRSSQLGPVLAVALVVFIILMQASILDSVHLFAKGYLVYCWLLLVVCAFSSLVTEF